MKTLNPKCSSHPDYDGYSIPDNQCTTCWDLFDMKNREKEFLERKQRCGGCQGVVPDGCDCEHKDRWVYVEVCDHWVISAPQWYKDQMAALRKMPPPTLEKIRAQWKASAEWDAKYGFECVEKIKKAKYLR